MPRAAAARRYLAACGVLANRSAGEQLEARNHAAALTYQVERIAAADGDFRFSKSLIRALHVRLMNGLVSGAAASATTGCGSSVPRCGWPDSMSCQIL